jgi:hypothetical protein
MPWLKELVTHKDVCFYPGGCCKSAFKHYIYHGFCIGPKARKYITVRRRVTPRFWPEDPIPRQRMEDKIARMQQKHLI